MKNLISLLTVFLIGSLFILEAQQMSYINVTLPKFDKLVLPAQEQIALRKAPEHNSPTLMCRHYANKMESTKVKTQFVWSNLKTKRQKTYNYQLKSDTPIPVVEVSDNWYRVATTFEGMTVYIAKADCIDMEIEPIALVMTATNVVNPPTNVIKSGLYKGYFFEPDADGIIVGRIINNNMCVKLFSVCCSFECYESSNDLSITESSVVDDCFQIKYSKNNAIETSNGLITLDYNTLSEQQLSKIIALAKTQSQEIPNILISGGTDGSGKYGTEICVYDHNLNYYSLGLDNDLKFTEGATVVYEDTNAMHPEIFHYQRGIALSREGKKTEAFEAFAEAANFGNDKALKELIKCYSNGIGTTQDYAKAIEHLNYLAKKDDAEAQTQLGLYYLNGTGIEKDVFSAFQLFTTAANNGNAEAQFNLGLCYATGKAIEANSIIATEYILKAAQQGYTKAQCYIGNMFASGDGVERNIDNAVKWLSIAADKGDLEAIYLLARQYDSPLNNYTEAFKLFMKAAENDYNSAQFFVGKYYVEGKGTKKDFLEGVKWLTLAAEKNNADALALLGQCATDGYGIQKDFARAADFYKKGAEAGSKDAQFYYAEALYYGIGTRVNYNEARKLFESLSKDSKARHYSDAINYLGLCSYYGKSTPVNYQMAIDYFNKAIELNNSSAQNNLGMCYFEGKGVKKDVDRAYELFIRSANSGNTDGITSMALCNFKGKGTKKDKSKAIGLYRKAAAERNARAMYYLGLCYLEGDGIDKKQSKGVELLIEAAKKGFAEAQYLLSKCYKEGKGIAKNSAEAGKWAALAVEQGHKDAAKEID